MANIVDTPEISHGELHGGVAKVAVGALNKEASVSISRLLAGVDYGTELPDTSSREGGSLFVKTGAFGLEFWYLQDAGGGTPGNWIKFQATSDLQSAKFTIPALTRTRLRTTAADTPVLHSIGAFNGADVAGVATKSAVSNVGRITLPKSGSANINVVKKFRVLSAQAGSIRFVLRQYSSAGSLKRMRPWGIPIEADATGEEYVAAMSTGIWPVSAGDYLTLEAAYEADAADRTIEIDFPDESSDGQGVEIFYAGAVGVEAAVTREQVAALITSALTGYVTTAMLNARLAGLPSGGSGSFTADDRTVLERSVQIGAISIDTEGNITFGTDSGTTYTLEIGKRILPIPTAVQDTYYLQASARALPDGVVIWSTAWNHIASASGGLSEAQVQAQIRALVEATYLQGNTDVISVTKLPVASGNTSGIIHRAEYQRILGAVQLADVTGAAEKSNADLTGADAVVLDDDADTTAPLKRVLVSELDKRYGVLSSTDEERIADLERRSGYNFETFNLLNAHSVDVDTSYAQYALDATLSVPPETRESTLTLKVQGHGEATFLLSDFYAKPVLAGSATFDTADVISYTNGGDTFYLGRDAGGKFRFGSDTGDTYSVSLDLNQYRSFPDGAGHGGDLIGFKEDPRGGLDAVDITPLVNRLISAHGASGISRAQAEALIVSWAKANNPTGRIPEKLLPEDLDHLLDAISDGGWRDVATADVGVPRQAKWTTSAIRALAESAWYNGLPPISPRRENQWIPVRVLVADKDKVESGDWELRNDTVPSIKGTEFERAGDDLESSPTYAYYQVQVPNLPVGETPRISAFEKFRIDADKVDTLPDGGVHGQYLTPRRGDPQSYDWENRHPTPISALPDRFTTGEEILLDRPATFSRWYVATVGADQAKLEAADITGAGGNANAQWGLALYSASVTHDAQVRNQLVLTRGSTITDFNPVGVEIDGVVYNLGAQLTGAYVGSWVVQGYPRANWTAGSEHEIIIKQDGDPLHDLPNGVRYKIGDYLATDEQTLIPYPGAQTLTADQIGFNQLRDGAGTGIAVTTSAPSGTRQNTLDKFTPAYDLDDHQAGLIQTELVFTLHNKSDTGISFSNTAAQDLRDVSEFVFNSNIIAANAYSASAQEGVRVADVPIYLSRGNIGNIEAYLCRDAANELGIYLRFVGKSGSSSFSIGVQMEVAAISQDPNQGSGGGGGLTVGENLISGAIGTQRNNSRSRTFRDGRTLGDAKAVMFLFSRTIPGGSGGRGERIQLGLPTSSNNSYTYYKTHVVYHSVRPLGDYFLESVEDVSGNTGHAHLYFTLSNTSILVRTFSRGQQSAPLRIIGLYPLS